MKTYRITFDRIGRTHDVPDLIISDLDEKVTPNDIEDAVYAYARPLLLSRDFAVTCYPSEERGSIDGGRYGTFRITREVV